MFNGVKTSLGALIVCVCVASRRGQLARHGSFVVLVCQERQVVMGLGPPHKSALPARC